LRSASKWVKRSDNDLSELYQYHKTADKYLRHQIEIISKIIALELQGWQEMAEQIGIHVSHHAGNLANKLLEQTPTGYRNMTFDTDLWRAVYRSNFDALKGVQSLTANTQQHDSGAVKVYLNAVVTMYNINNWQLELLQLRIDSNS